MEHKTQYCEQCEKRFPQKKMIWNHDAGYWDGGDTKSGWLCRKCAKDRKCSLCNCDHCVKTEEFKQLTKADKHRLKRVYNLWYNSRMGMYPKNERQHAHFKKLEKLGYLEFWMWGYAMKDYLSKKPKEEKPLYKITNKGSQMVWTIKHWEALK